jgi:hypothetical protein
MPTLVGMIRNKVNALSDDELDVIVDQVCGDLDSMVTTDDERESLRKRGVEALDYLADGGRDWCDFTDSAGVIWWHSGGMSWGDNPTEAFQHIYALDMIGAW